MDDQTKACSKCGELKLLSAFYRSKTGSHGRHAYCKDCAIAYSKARGPAVYQLNKERIKERALAWQRDNPERYRARLKAWSSANKEALREKGRQYAQNNREKLVEWGRVYRAESEVYRRNKTAYYLRNKEKIHRQSSDWRSGNQERSKEIRQKSRLQAVESLSDSYVKSVLSMRGIEVPQGLIEMKREQLKLYRAAKQLKEAINEATNQGDSK